MIYAFLLQWMAAILITTIKFAPRGWATGRVVLTGLLWPLALVWLMVSLPVKALRQRHDPQMELDRIARQHREENSPTLERQDTITFWRGVLTDENTTESEKIVARELLTQFYEVPEVPTTEPEVVNTRLGPVRQTVPIIDAEKREKALWEAAQLLTEQAQGVLPVCPKSKSYVSMSEPPTESATAHERVTVCPVCGGSGKMGDSRHIRPCVRCGRSDQGR